MPYLVKLKHFSLLLFCLSFLAACSQRPAQSQIDHYKQESHARVASKGLLAKSIAELTEQNNKQSAIHIVNDGLAAFTVRASLITAAADSIDAQYYMIKDDMTGNAFLSGLVVAAKRGVRVRLLVDDLATSGHDKPLRALSQLPNADVRIFNPFYERDYKFTGFISDFGRLNSRMHNKSFTVDGLATVVGGRNIGDEYFSARDDLEFADLDALAFGPIVKEVSSAFDLYWNSPRSYPIESLVAEVDTHKQLLKLEQKLFTFYLKDYTQAVRNYHKKLKEIDEWRQLYWCDGNVLVDNPEDLTDRNSVAHRLGRELTSSNNKIIVSSPYFVPQDTGTEGLSKLAKRGVEVSIITNSLAATDVAAVHAGYKSYRQTLLENGVLLYEVKPNIGSKTRLAFLGRKADQASLHSKMMVVDDDQTFIGSFNWDPRSVDLNTEMGLLLSCPDLNNYISNKIQENIQSYSYQLYLDEGKIHWREYVADKDDIIYTNEPQVGWWKSFQAWAAGLLPIEDQL